MARPKKQPAKPKADPTPPKQEKQLYNHDRHMMCSPKSTAYPAFLKTKNCPGKLVAEQTTNAGRTKVWKCPVCGRRVHTEGRTV